jgi:phosphoribosylamine---glycine ligase
MKVLVVGSGGREAALVWAAQRSPQAPEVIAAPGNAGIAATARCLPVKAEDLDGQVRLAQDEHCDLVLIGPEVPLTLGLADRLAAAGIPAFGPSAAAARLEGSKSFAKDFMQRHGIPTASYRACTTLAEAEDAVRAYGAPVVIKADGLAAGKGVTVAMSQAEALRAVRSMMADKVFGPAGEKVVVEEFLEGEEASVLAFCDGRLAVPMVAAQDHKRINDFDQGPNTGGMGAYAPAPVVTPALLERVQREILDPTLRGLAEEGMSYRGVLYAGLMITADGPKVIEYNCRFGDPETQAVLPLLRSDLVEIALACVQGRLEPGAVVWAEGAAVCVVIASGGYPGEFTKGLPITGLEDAARLPGVHVWHAGTSRQDGKFVTAGGRVLNVAAAAPTLAAAVKQAYAAASKIRFDGMHYRHDIAARALNKK